MTGWTLVNTHSTQGRTFQRPLNVLELRFFWTGLFNGVNDFLQRFELRLLNGSQDAHLLSEDNIKNAWLSTKRRYPLTGATVRGVDCTPLRLITDSPTEDTGAGYASEPHFVVHEHNLAVVRPQEIVFGSVADTDEIEQRINMILDGPRTLSQELLMQLYVFRNVHPERTNVFHLVVFGAHCITDRVGINTIARCFLDTLARGAGREPPQIPLEERLAMVISSMDLQPARLHPFSPAIHRWRRAVGTIILRLKTAKLQGRHTLPCRFTHSTSPSPPVPRTRGISMLLTHSQTVTVKHNCRFHHLSFGTAYLALARVAMTRVLYRRYLRGEVSEEKWADRRRQPHFGWFPLCVRPYLDRAWFEKGGGSEYMLTVLLLAYQLPFMTLGGMENEHRRVWPDGAPPFSDLLTFDRLLYHAALVKKEVAAFSSHPLFFEIVYAAGLAQAEHARLRALQWMNRMEIANRPSNHGISDEVLAASDLAKICAFGGTSISNLDLITPTKYPLPPTHPLSPYSLAPHPAKAGYAIHPLSSLSAAEVDGTPKIAMENSKLYTRLASGDLYINADGWNGQLHMQVFYDANVFDEDVVREWLGEVKEAVLWYLGQPHPSRQGVDGKLRISRESKL